ncbi:MAG: DUF4091 domain-containing protein [Ruminococcaceae bacterium]|nr:DUF4091 domain-containing protein [Oscillospiraceae bacterium]
MLQTKLVSSLEKCFIDQTPADFAEVTRVRTYKNVTAAVQLLAYNPDESNDAVVWYTLQVDAPEGVEVKLRTVEGIPNYVPTPATPATAMERDSHFLRTTPGLYPDLLLPLQHHGTVVVVNQQLRTAYIEFTGDLPAGDHNVTIRLVKRNGEVAVEHVLALQVIDTCLPEQDSIVTMWFYADCLADYYDVEVWSEKHWAICERFARTAVKNGINMLMVPVFTPPLDTAVGQERTTTQLVDVTVTNGEYTFGFEKVDRWMDMLKSCGVKYYEIAHLFTQWGAYHAPKVMATVDGEYKRIFGWETEAAGEEYVTFLQAFLAAFTDHLTARGLHDEVYFHISDEPNSDHLAQYKINRSNVLKVLDGWKIMDALSHLEFYKEGLCEIPVVYSASIHQFMPEDIKERWVYYCCGPWVGYSNRFMCMHSARTRYMGTQMYAHGIKGFLHWGYNFFKSQFSDDENNPFLNANAAYWAGGGDANSVYPGAKGQPLESIRLVAFRQGLEDIRVMKLCEQYYGRDAVMAEIEKVVGKVTFDKCVDDTATMTALRDRMDDMIIKAIG